MPFVRREVRTLGGRWNDTLSWYAKGVGALKQKPLTAPDSWWFLGAMHGFHPVVWTQFGIITDSTPLPADAVQVKFWEQCQHQTWYFLPWHRGYLYAVEEILRTAIVDLGGPDDWALPYWNYSGDGPDARVLPEEFAEPNLPDGSNNPLFVEQRYGDGSLPITIDPAAVALTALNDTIFTGGTSDIPPGFGGPVTTFHHGPENRTTNGGLESLPHNIVHSLVGGAKPGTDPNQWWNAGLMSIPITAGLDPIFWLHHANIDRLWTLWSSMSGHANPVDPTKPGNRDWLDGPADRRFVMPLSGGREWSFSAKDVLDTRAQPLDYEYDDQTPPVVSSRMAERLTTLSRQTVSLTGGSVEEAAVSDTKQPEMIGASEPDVAIAGQTQVRVSLDAGGIAPLRKSLARAATAAADTATTQEPPRVFLKLEGIRGTADAAVYHVYVNLPADKDPKDHPERRAGIVSLFGVSASSSPDGPSAGSGINQVFEITPIVDALHLSGDELQTLDVRFVPSNAATEAARIEVGRLSVFKMGE
ncbi:tyrosinase family protein [Neorhizobium sp. NPDC001467]|uniref:tyrosinase family protein n=1 Tax=Neorhizobium sp. NPDC001467 TaxID=3390595 RepID=UPI003D0644AC